jgi:regulatory protein
MASRSSASDLGGRFSDKGARSRHEPITRRRESLAERRARRSAVDDPEVVLNAASRFLETRARSVHEVRHRLADAGYRPELIEDAVVRLLDVGILNDESFARSWVESRDRARPRGEIALRRELALKGVDRAVVEAVLTERRGGDERGGGSATSSDAVAADRLLARHARALGRVADLRVRRQRAYALLARNGFDPDTCREAIARLEGGPGEQG